MEKERRRRFLIVEFLCETDQVEPGKIFKPKEGTGSGLGAFNVRGAQLVTADYAECEIETERLDDGGRSRVAVRVANILSYTVLKILAFQDRHENKDSYDLIYRLLYFGEGAEDTGHVAAQSAIRDDAQVRDALQLLAERFESADQTARTPMEASSLTTATKKRRRRSARKRGRSSWTSWLRWTCVTGWRASMSLTSHRTGPSGERRSSDRD